MMSFLVFAIRVLFHITLVSIGHSQQTCRPLLHMPKPFQLIFLILSSIGMMSNVLQMHSFAYPIYLDFHVSVFAIFIF